MPLLETATAVVEAGKEMSKAEVISAKETGVVLKEGTERINTLGKAELKEIAGKNDELGINQGDAVLSKLEEIKNLTPEQLNEKMSENLSLRNHYHIDGMEKISEGLTDEQKERIKEVSGWSDEIVDAFRSEEEYEIYQKADLVETEIGGKKCLLRSDIDWTTPYETGKFDENGDPIYETNQERVSRGRSPLDENGNPIQLHHIGQHVDSPLAELTFEEHRCNGNDTILHNKNLETETHGEGNTWDQERGEYWKNRADYNERGGIDV